MLDREQLAERLAIAAPDEREALLHQHAALLDVGLAYGLKEVCYAAWSSEPALAVGAAAALAALAARTDHNEIHALAAWTAGIAALTEGLMERAIAHLDDAAARFTALEQPHTAAATRVSKLIPLALLGRYDEAIATGLAARAVFLAHGDELAAGKIEQNLGNIYDRRDRYAEAEQFYRAARDRFARLNDQRQLVQVDNGLANVLSQQHRFRDAARLYEGALARAESVGMEVMQALIECNLGNLALSQGRYDRALDYLERSRRRYAGLGMPHESALAEQSLADAYLELNLFPEAIAIYARIGPTFAELGMRFEQAWTLAHHGRALLASGQPAAAQALLAAARTLFDAEENRVCAAMALLLEAQRCYAVGDYPAAWMAATEAEPALWAGGPREWAALAGWLRGETARVLGAAEALPLLEAALHAAQTGALPQIAQRCWTSLGLLAADAGAATAAFQQAVMLIETLRAPLPAEEFRTAFFADKLTPYAELVRLCLADPAPERRAEALGYVERSRSRALVDMLGGAVQALPRPRDDFEAERLARLTDLREELNWFYNQVNRPPDGDAPRNPAALEQLEVAVREREAAILEIARQLQQRGGDAGLAAYNVEPLDVVRLQQDLGPDTALVEYFSLDGELLAFVLSAEGIDVVRNLGREEQVEVAVSQLRFQTDALRHGVERMRPHMEQLGRRARHYLARLYDLLLRPIESRMGARRLVVAPYRTLHYVPFHALYDGAAYLIERREVCYAPSAGVLHHCLARPPRPLERALLLGVPDERAPLVRAEVAGLAPLFPAARTLLDEEATLAALREHSPTADLLHLACHGLFRPDSPLFSALRLADGWLTVRDAYGLTLDASLVVLSACETGVSVVAPGDELIGLARGFFSAGAATLLVSLWTVEDATTTALMQHVYTRLRAGDRPAAALRAAQCELLRRYPHPFFWSPFVLLGRW